jgi:hypothetical protein
MNFIIGGFWLRDKSHTEFTPIAKRNKINPVKTGQKIILIRKKTSNAAKISGS